MLPDPSFRREFLRREFTFYIRLFSLSVGHMDSTTTPCRIVQFQSENETIDWRRLLIIQLTRTFL